MSTQENNDPQAQLRSKVEQALRGANLPEDTAAQAWDSFFGAADTASFRSGMNGIENLPNSVKLQLMQLKYPEAASSRPSTSAPPTTPAKPPAPAQTQARPASPPALIPSGPPGAQGRPAGLGLPPEYKPDAKSLWGALSTPLTETFGISPRDTIQKQNRAMEAAFPSWMRPAARMEHGVEEAATGALEQLSAPLSILLAPIGAFSEGAGAIPTAARATSRLLSVIGGGMSAADATKRIYNFFKTGDTGEIGKAAMDVPFTILGARAVRGPRMGEASVTEEPTGVSGAEAEPVSGPEYFPKTPRLGTGRPEPARISNTGPQRRQLPAPSTERAEIDAIANSAGPFKGQVHDWARKDLGEIQKLREQAQKNFETVQKQFSGETAPFAGQQPPVTNASQAVPKGSTSQIPTGKGEFTPGGPRMLLDRARSQYEALDKLYRLKARQAGVISDTAGPDLAGRPTREAVTMRGLPAPGGAHEPPPGAIQIHPVDYYYNRPEQQTGNFPVSRQLGPGSAQIDPNLTLEQHLKQADFMPQAVLKHNIELMRQAAAEHAAQMMQAAGKDPEKLLEVKDFVEQAGSRLDAFQASYERQWGKDEPPPAPPTPKSEPKPKGPKPKPAAAAKPAEPETIPPKPETAAPKVETEAPKPETSAPASETPPEPPKREGTKKAPKPKSDQKGFVDLIVQGGKDNPWARQVFASLQRGDKKTAIAALVKGEWEEAQAKAIVEDATARMKSGESAKPLRPESSPVSSSVAERIGNQLRMASEKGLTQLHLTFDRGPGKKELVIGINPELDTPEELAATAKKYGATGMATITSSDPERPVEWKFLIDEPSKPPGTK